MEAGEILCSLPTQHTLAVMSCHAMPMPCHSSAPCCSHSPFLPSSPICTAAVEKSWSHGLVRSLVNLPLRSSRRASEQSPTRVPKVQTFFSSPFWFSFECIAAWRRVIRRRPPGLMCSFPPNPRTRKGVRGCPSPAAQATNELKGGVVGRGPNNNNPRQS